ncbi:MAG: hypothetical protein ACYTAS_14700, partial [Planctomycetota bacterium]
MMLIDDSRSSLASLAVFVVLSFLASAATGQHLDEFADPCTAADGADFNEDGTVNFLDFSILALH